MNPDEYAAAQQVGAGIPGAKIAERPPSQIGMEVSRQPEEIDQLHMVIAELESRLAPILRADDQAENTTSGPPEEVVVPFAEQLRQHNRGIHHAANRIRGISARLEL